MTAKQELLAGMVSRDKSGVTLRIHELLVALGFKWKDRAQTMMYFAKGNGGAELGLFAIRPGLVSFPRNFWESRPVALRTAMNLAGSGHSIAVDGGWFTSSQYSAGQIALNGSTEAQVVSIIRDIVVPEGRLAGARI